MSWLDPLLPQPGAKWWGSKYLKAVFQKIVEMVDGKAPVDHEHVVGGTTVVTRGDEAARSASGTTLHVRDDEDEVERVVDGALASTLASQRWVQDYPGAIVPASGLASSVFADIAYGADTEIHSISEDSAYFDILVLRATTRHSTAQQVDIIHNYDSVDRYFISHRFDPYSGVYQYVIPIIGGAAGAASIKATTTSGGDKISAEVCRVPTSIGGLASAIADNGGRPISAHYSFETLHTITVPAGEEHTLFVFASNLNTGTGLMSIAMGGSTVITKEIVGDQGQELLDILLLPPGTYDIQVHSTTEYSYFTGCFMKRFL